MYPRNLSRRRHSRRLACFNFPGFLADVNKPTHTTFSDADDSGCLLTGSIKSRAGIQEKEFENKDAHNNNHHFRQTSRGQNFQSDRRTNHEHPETENLRKCTSN